MLAPKTTLKRSAKEQKEIRNLPSVSGKSILPQPSQPLLTVQSLNDALLRNAVKTWRMHTLSSRCAQKKRIDLLVRNVSAWRTALADARRRRCSSATEFPAHSLVAESAAVHHEQPLQEHEQIHEHLNEDWRKSVRADIHRRLVLCGRIWSAWTLFVHNAKIGRANVARADALAARFAKSRVWHAWTLYHSHRRAHIAAHNAASSFCKRMRLNSSFGAWRTRFARRRISRLQHELASRIQTRNLERSAIRTWIQKHAHRIQMARSEQSALIHCNRRISVAAMRSWIRAHRRREAATMIYAKAVEFELHFIAKHAWSKWHAKWNHIRTHQAQMETAVSVHHKQLVRKYLLKWILETRIRLAAMEKAAKLALLLDNQLKRRAWRALKSILDHKQSAGIHNAKRIVASAFGSWMRHRSARMDARDRIALMPAAQIHARKLISRSISTWKRRAQHIKISRQKALIAATHNRIRLLKKGMHALQSNVTCKTQKRHRTTRATQWYNLTLLERSWTIWRQYLLNHIQTRRKMRIAESFHQTILKKKLVNMLKSNVIIKNQHRTKLESAEKFYHHALLHKIVQSWRLFVYTENIRSRQTRQANRFRYFSLMSMCVSAWHQQLISRRQERMRWRLAMAHFDRVSATRHLNAWKLYVHHRLSIRSRMDHMAHRRRLSVMTIAFGEWRDQLFVARESTHIVMSIRHLRDVARMRRIWRAWTSFTHTRSLSRRKETMICTQIIQSRNQHTLISVFRHWLLRYRHYVRVRVLSQRSNHAYRVQYIRKTWTLWRQHYRHREWIHVTDTMQRQFRRSRVLRHAMHRWISSRDNWHQVYMSRVVQPITYWGLSLSRKVFGAWRSYVSKKREMHDQIKLALEWHQFEMVRSGVRILVEADDVMRKHRQDELHAMEMHGLTDKEQRLASKYGHRWRLFAAQASIRHRGRLGMDHKSDLRKSVNQPAVDWQPKHGFAVNDASLSVPSTHASHVYAPTLLPRPKSKRPQPRIPEFLFDATTGKFVRTQSVPVSTLVAGGHDDASKSLEIEAAISQMPDQSTPCDHDVPKNVSAPPQDASQSTSQSTTISKPPLLHMSMQDMETMLMDFDRDRVQHQIDRDRLTLLQSTLSSYLDGDHDALSRLHASISSSNTDLMTTQRASMSLMDVFDEIKVVTERIVAFESKRQDMLQKVTELMSITTISNSEYL